MSRKRREGGGGGRGAGPGDHQQHHQGCKRAGTDALSMDGGLREVSVSVVFSVWCLLFLLRSQFLHSQTDPSDFYEEHGKRDSYCKVMPLEAYVLPHHNVSSSSPTCQPSSYPPPPPPPSQQDAPAPTPPNASSSSPGAAAFEGLDAFRTRIMQQGNKPPASETNNINDITGGPTTTHRLEPSGAEYNYAAASKGAKVLAHNKEAKGASNILGGDKDKYLRNPCSAEDKFVVVELAEETLVDTVALANLEHYSSNFKEFELHGATTYPPAAEAGWEPLGRWARYLRLRLVSHYGSGFYCILSYLEVYGVDAVERMLQDFIAKDRAAAVVVEPSAAAVREVNNTAQVSTRLDTNTGRNDTTSSGGETKNNNESRGAAGDAKPPPAANNEAKLSTGRTTHGDGVLKILMQKMRSLELGLSTLEEYTRLHGAKLPDLQNGLSQTAMALEKMKADVLHVVEWKDSVAKDLQEFKNWKSAVSSKLDDLARENAAMRQVSGMQEMRGVQETLQNKELAVFSISLFFACLALFKLVLLFLFGADDDTEERTCRRTSKPWMLVLASSSFTTLIVLLYS
ncbi:hypothetical protein PR202_ga10601 [Eleusine coracana subsp. coracana]|uniref:SUN domain-containing protein n=1 Tax=Eleusine coracana subsp. coracana TaxID=191504 RepID=A0AAV5C782_ELECO|nr:hypothetical protein PR202_ga10601 [Eleusine coracana subsp. coracana]